MGPTETCEVCGTEIVPEEAVRAEVSIDDEAMCPTPMSFHPQCFQRASEIWTQPSEALCAVDPEHPETAQWLERSRTEG